MIITALTSQVRSNLAAVLVGSGYAAAQPRYMQWGTGAAPAFGTDETISSPNGNRVTVSGQFDSTLTHNDTLILTGALTSSGPQVITNIGLFNNQNSSADTLLASQLNPGATSVSVTDASNFPGSYPFDVQMLSEVMTVVTGTANTWTVTRATNGSPVSANVIPAGTRVVGGNNTANGSMFLKSSFADGVLLNPGDTMIVNISVQFI